MKTTTIVLSLAGLALLLIGCASEPTAKADSGPVEATKGEGASNASIDKPVIIDDSASGDSGGTHAAGGESKWLTSLEEGMIVAKRDGKPMLVDFYADWCGPCKQYKSDVFPTAEFKKAAADYVLVMINVDNQPEVAGRYKIEGIPDIRILDAKGDVVDQLVGFGGADPLLAMMSKNAKS